MKIKCAILSKIHVDVFVFVKVNKCFSLNMVNVCKMFHHLLFRTSFPPKYVLNFTKIFCFVFLKNIYCNF